MKLLSTFFIFMFLFFGLLAPRNPDYNFPVSMELIILGFLHFAIAFKPKAPPGYRLLFTRHEKQLFYVALLLLVVIVTPRALYSVGFFGPVPNLCKAAGENFQVIECLMQTAINGPFGLRTLFQNYVALYILVLATYLFRQPTPLSGKTEPADEKDAPLGLIIISVWMTLFVLISFWLQFKGANTVLPEWLTYTVFYRRLSTVIANPGWVWPYVSMGFAAAITLSFSRVRRFWLFIVATLTCGAGMLATQQRGVLLAFITMAITALVAPNVLKIIANRKLPRKTIIRTGIGSVLVFAIVTGILLYPDFLNQVAMLVGYSFKATNLESGRFSMWAAAADIISSAPFWGHGYGSWFDTIGDYNAKKGGVMVFDTAHNFYIQLAVELGLLYASVHVALMVCTIKSALDMQSRIGKQFTFIFLSTVLAITLVQEIDYIRPTFYLFAMGCGLIFALKNLDSGLVTSLKGAGEPGWFLSLSTRGHAALGSFMVLAGVFSIYVFNVNAYPYEFHHNQKSPAKMTRWLGMSAKVATGSGFSKGYYAYYPNAETITKDSYSVELLNGSIPGFPLSGHSPSQPLITAVGNALIPAQTRVTFRSGGSDGTRVMTKKIGYPVIYANSILIPYGGNAKLEFREDKVRVRCRGVCEVLASSCGRNSKAFLTVMSGARNAEIVYNIGTIADSFDLPEILNSATFEGSPKTLALSPGGRVAEINPVGAPTALGLVAIRLQVNGGSLQNRNAGSGAEFFLSDGPCG